MSSVTPVQNAMQFFDAVNQLSESNNDDKKINKLQQVALNALNDDHSFTVIAGALTAEGGNELQNKIRNLSKEESPIRSDLKSLLDKVSNIKNSEELTLACNDGETRKIYSDLITNESKTIKDVVLDSVVDNNIPVPIDGETLDLVIAYLHGQPNITKENLRKIFFAANYLEIPGLIQECNYQANEILNYSDLAFALTLLNDHTIAPAVDLGKFLGKPFGDINDLRELLNKEELTEQDELLLACLEKTTSLQWQFRPPFKELLLIGQVCSNLKKIDFWGGGRDLQNLEAITKELVQAFQLVYNDKTGTHITSLILKSIIEYLFQTTRPEFSTTCIIWAIINFMCSEIIKNLDERCDFCSKIVNMIPKETGCLRESLTLMIQGIKENLSAVEIYQRGTENPIFRDAFISDNFMNVPSRGYNTPEYQENDKAKTKASFVLFWIVATKCMNNENIRRPLTHDMRQWILNFMNNPDIDEASKHIFAFSLGEGLGISEQELLA